MSNPKARTSSKITDNHSTFTEASAEVVSKAQSLDLVTKISLGEIRHVPGGRRDIKFSPINGGIKAVVRGSGGVHHIYIYCNNPSEVQSILSTSFRR